MTKGKIRNSSHAEAKHKLFAVLGKNGVTWLLLGLTAGVFIAIIEFLLSIQIANLLYVLKIQDQPIPLPSPLNLLPNTAGFFMATFIAIGAIRSSLFFITSQSSVIISELIHTRLKLLTFHEAFSSQNALRSISLLNIRVSEHFFKASLFCGSLNTFIPGVIQTLIILALMANKAFMPTAISLTFIAIVGFFVHRMNKYVKTITARFPQEQETIIRQMNRMSKNWFLLKSLRTMDKEHFSLILSTMRHGTNLIRAYFIGNFTASLTPFFGILVVTIMLHVHSLTHSMSNIVFLSFLYLFLRLIQNLSNLVVVFTQLNSHWPSFKIARDYILDFPNTEFTQALEPATRLSSVGKRKPLHELEQSKKASSDFMERNYTLNSPPEIALSKIYFRYRPDLPYVIENISLQVLAGEQIALMGPSGSGKSTILSLILGMESPSQGTILINNEPPKVFMEKYSNSIGYVGAEPFLIEGTIRDNLLYGENRGRNDSDLILALEKARLGSWMRELTATNPLDYFINEAGDGLSTGQKQRLMIARALARQPKLLFLDEVSANLDEKTEAELAEVIFSLRSFCTTLIVTHRAGLIPKESPRLLLKTV